MIISAIITAYSMYNTLIGNKYSFRSVRLRERFMSMWVPPGICVDDAFADIPGAAARQRCILDVVSG